MVLEGMVPVLTQTPPTKVRASTTATFLCILEAATAARWPAGPEPMTTRSYLTALIQVYLPGFNAGIARPDAMMKRTIRRGYHSGVAGVLNCGSVFERQEKSAAGGGIRQRFKRRCARQGSRWRNGNQTPDRRIWGSTWRNL